MRNFLSFLFIVTVLICNRVSADVPIDFKPGLITVPLSATQKNPEFKNTATTSDKVAIRLELTSRGDLLVTPLLPADEQRLTLGPLPNIVRRNETRELHIRNGARFLRLFKVGDSAFALVEQKDWLSQRKELGLIQLKPVLGRIPSWRRGLLRASPWVGTSILGSLFLFDFTFPGSGIIGILAGGVAGLAIELHILSDEGRNSGVQNNSRLNHLRYAGSKLIIDRLIENDLNEITDLEFHTEESDSKLRLSELLQDMNCQRLLRP